MAFFYTGGALLIVLISAILFLIVNTFIIYIVSLITESILKLKNFKSLKKSFFVALIIFAVSLAFSFLGGLLGPVPRVVVMLLAWIVLFLVLMALMYKFFFAGKLKRRSEEILAGFLSAIAILIFMSILGVVIGLIVGIITMIAMGGGPMLM
ncbi:hypothetical protein KY335_02610 [Candidatus Woesearchaeota archaeon]|nr:hypothetical protein [Candidatus Woesearchaeota archaeon]MBW3014111.1 hypothetical protein [Candidatus Woesearchaeota archaeon]